MFDKASDDILLGDLHGQVGREFQKAVAWSSSETTMAATTRLKENDRKSPLYLGKNANGYPMPVPATDSNEPNS